MSFRNRCIDALYNVATGSKWLRTILAPIGALGFFGILALLVWLSYWLDGWLGLPKISPLPYNLALAAPLVAVGILLVLKCNIRFFRAHGTPVPLNPPRELVQTGPYAVTRNPMLTGVFLILFGIGFFWGSICVTFVFTPLFILLMALEVKYIEEPELEKRLGQPYVDYKKRVPMFVPRIRKQF